MKKRIALMLALTTVFLSACGEKTDDTSADLSETAKEQMTTAETTETQETEETTTDETTEPEPEAPVADTAYWDLLCAEYDGKHDYYAFVDDVMVFQAKVNNDSYPFMKYNTSSKELVEYTFNTNVNSIWDTTWVHGNKLHSIFFNDNTYQYDKYCCYDMNENELYPPLNLSDYGEYLKNYYYDNGIILSMEKDSEQNHYIISQDFSESRIVTITRDLGHGKNETDDDLDLLVITKNTLYVRDQLEGKYYAVDIETGESKLLDTDTYDHIGRDITDSNIGKYYLSYSGIFDLEAGENISELDFDIGSSAEYYFDLKGGYQYFVTTNSDDCTEIYKLILPENYKDFAANETEYAQQYGELIYTSEQSLEYGFPYFINGEYMTIRDKAGTFFVNLTTGEEIEITVDE